MVRQVKPSVFENTQLSASVEEFAHLRDPSPSSTDDSFADESFYSAVSEPAGDDETALRDPAEDESIDLISIEDIPVAALGRPSIATDPQRRFSISCSVDLTDGPSVLIELPSDDDDEDYYVRSDDPDAIREGGDDEVNRIGELLEAEIEAEELRQQSLVETEGEASPLVDIQRSTLRKCTKLIVIDDDDDDDDDVTNHRHGEKDKDAVADRTPPQPPKVRRLLRFQEVEGDSAPPATPLDGTPVKSSNSEEEDIPEPWSSPLVRPPAVKNKTSIIIDDDDDDDKLSSAYCSDKENNVYSPSSIAADGLAHDFSHLLLSPKTPSTPRHYGTPAPPQTPRSVYRTPKTSVKPRFNRQRASAELLEEYNQRVFDGQLEFIQLEWNRRLSKTAGQAKYSAGVYKIELSWKVVDEMERLRNTLAHEMCHIAVWFYHGFNLPPHGKVFMSFGARFRMFYSDLVITRSHTYEINYKFQYLCLLCGYSYGRHSKSIDVERFRCGNGGCGENKAIKAFQELKVMATYRLSVLL